MKKTIFTVMVLLLALTSSMAQGAKEGADLAAFAPQQEIPVRVLAMKGPTAMGMVRLMEDAKNGAVHGNAYSFEVIASPSEAAPKIVKGEVDIAALPANLASVLYNNTKGGISVVAINTLGVLYILENGNTVNSIADLKGKTIYASGKGATPEYGLNYVLASAGLEEGKDVKIEWKSEHAECVAALLSAKDGVAMLPQPFATTALSKSKDMRIAVDLNAAWADNGNGAMVTGVLVARKAFIEEHKAALDTFLGDYAASTAFTNSNIDASAKLIGALGIVPEAVAKKAIPYCNIVCITGSEMKEKLSLYLEALYNQDKKSVGGALPEEGFYYL